MSETTEYGFDGIEQIFRDAEYLRDLHEDVSFVEHALITGRRRIVPYEPTFFLYVYFTFNTIFSIDWKESATCGELVDSKVFGEVDRIKSLIDFCFLDPSFASLYFPTFVEIVTMRFSDNEILEALDSIVVDGKKVKAADKGNAITSCKQLFTKEGFLSKDSWHMKTLYSFIYKVRCNIVHGSKSMDLLNEPKQKERILIYSYYLIALQHMLFMFLRDLDKGFWGSKSEHFVQKLRESHLR